MPANRWDPSPPTSRHDFEIAIMCALPLEADAVTALFDKRWDSKSYGKAPGDTNTYSTGAIGRHNVVLVHLPNMGKVAAATAAAFLRASYEWIKLALVVGICGGVPFRKSSKDEILLGDVVISDGIIQYDLGRRFPHGFVRKDHVQDNLPRPGPAVRTFLAKLQARETSRLQERTLEHLDVLQRKSDNRVTYLRPVEDWLFKPTYRHKHHRASICPTCDSETGGVCDAALTLGCKKLGCDEQELVLRTRSKASPGVPAIHFGLFASGDSVMKSGEDRDRAASRDGVIAFEMEGAGAWEAFPGCLIIKGVCDYADSHKSKKWQAYAAATAAATTKAVLQNWDPETANSLRSFSPHLSVPTDAATGLIDPSRRVAILKTLHTSPYRDRKERNPDRVTGTCGWFVAHDSFQRWRESPSSSMLLVSADPGCGKSVLAKYLVDSELSTTESRTTCYFFFKDDFEDQRSARSALCCILHQLFEQKAMLLSSKIAERFEAGGDNITSSFVELWDILLTASRDKNAGEIVCVLDAFDECDIQGQSEFTQHLGKLYGTNNNFNLKFLLTSRPYSHIRRGFQPLTIPGLPVIRLNGEIETELSKISKEIDIYIKARVRNIRESLKLKESEENLLLQELLRIPHRTYLWAHLTLDLIEDDVHIEKNRIREVTSRLPRTVDEAYERILNKSLDVEKAKTLLHIVIGATRPLTLPEMSIALTIREEHRSYQDLDLKLEGRFSEYIRDLCGLFVVIIDSKLYLLHQTAKEFLVQDESEGRRKSNSSLFKWKSSLCVQDSHRILSHICIWHLLFVEFSNDPLAHHRAIHEYLDRYIFLDYSAKNWAGHLRMSRTQTSAILASALEICDPDTNRCQTWLRIYWESTHGEVVNAVTALIIASYFGLEQLVKILLKASRAALNSKDGRHQRSALSWASENGFDDVVKLLLKGNWINFRFVTKLRSTNSVILDTTDMYDRTPLSYAARRGHYAIADRLIKRGARIDSADHVGGTPLSYAVCNGQKALVSLFLKKGHQLDSVHSVLQPLLWAAASRGDEATVALLLESGKVNADSRGEGGQTPLSVAAKMGNRGVVELLLNTGKVDINSRDNSGQTPLLLAAGRGRVIVVDLLLSSSKVDANLRDDWDRTPLILAAKNGRDLAVRLLLDSGKVDADLKDKNGRTALIWAAMVGLQTVAGLLLDSGKVDPNLKDDYNGQTPVSWAASNGNRDIVKLLLDTGKVDPNLPDKDGRTPIRLADRFEDIVKLLREWQG